MIIKDILKLKIGAKRRYALFISLAAMVVVGYTIFDMVVIANDFSMQVFNWVILVLGGLLGLFSLYITIGATLDIKAIDKDQALTANVKFIKFNKRGVSPKGTNEIIYTGQVFLDLDDGTEKLLVIPNVELNRKYTVMYGKHTNIGIVIENYKGIK